MGEAAVAEMLFEVPVPPPPPAPPRVVLKRTAAEIKQALRRRHPADKGMWVCIEEAFDGNTSRCGGIDLLAMGAWRSAKAKGLPGAGRYERRGKLDTRNCIVGYEVKVSRGDFRRELYGYRSSPTAKTQKYVPPWPGKAEFALRICHYFMFAVPQGLLYDDEIARREPWGNDAPRPGALYVPAGIGLVEVNDRGCVVRVDAEVRDPRPMNRSEIAELLRRVAGWSFRGST